ncbi:hypothetical protein ACFP7A_01110 [Sporolactobacillus kofuensis]|uniref:Actin-like protein N-terminal domain-containing protein n=1 Tax=Sporolactobacillus kofuensis TaxID=269672 RepID=A0ABW1WAK6_9BACL|nr:ParM/StbA family protein [Sporolactobacillus kofuensis]MCO7176997.1 ParM/StbA family protein [Sporolactobacillus kofuensis]
MNSLSYIDLGYGWTKGIGSGKQFFEPSVVGDARPLMDEQTKDGDLIYHDDDKSLFVGGLALRQSKIRYNSTGENKAETWTTEILLKSGLATLSPTGPTNLLTGLPVDYYMKQKKSMAMLIDGFNTSGPYQLEMVGNRYKVRANPLIANYKIVPQPFGSAMDYLLDDRGNVKKMSDAKKSILVIDIGYYTLDLLELIGMEIGKNSRSPHGLGVDTAYNILRGYLIDQLGRAPERFEMDRYVLSGEYAGYDIRPLVEQAFQALAQQILLEIDSLSTYYDLYLLTGGCAPLIKDFINLPNLVVLENSQFANVRGYGKIGARLWLK